MADVGTWIQGGLHTEISESCGAPDSTMLVDLDVSDDTLAAEGSASDLLVAPDGAWFREGSADFFASLGDPNPDYDAPLFAVKNLGFIGVRVSRSLVDIKLHPRNVSAAALRSVENVLSSIRSGLFRITYLREDWVSETVSSSALILCRLGEICTVAGTGVVAREANTVVH
jgi:hypothetical protein